MAEAAGTGRLAVAPSERGKPLVIGTDAGGTFVDAIIMEPGGRDGYGKALSTPAAPAVGLVNAVAAAAERFGASLAQVLDDCSLFLNGTTVTTNAMLERKGARVGFITTAGFEDTLAIARGMGRSVGRSEQALLDYHAADPAEPLVAPNLVRGVHERVDHGGRILRPLDMAEAEAVLTDLVESQRIEALAISLLWSFREPRHEELLARLARERYPHLYVTASCELAPVIREFERGNTTSANAYLGPTLKAYVTDVADGLRREAYHGQLLVMQSFGGLAPAQQIVHVPVSTVLSGPVGGIVAAQRLGEMIGERNLITADMGGTSFDVGLIVDGEPTVSATTVIDRHLIAQPAVDVATIGAGGGSVAWVDAVGVLRVGPSSQGADPGPAAYGLGGTLATVTDADLVLGYLAPDRFLGGTRPLDAEAAHAAVKRLARRLHLEVDEVAAGIRRIVDAHMADLMRKVSVQRGHDPRRFTVVAYGGAGPVHASDFGFELGAGKVVVPKTAPVFSGAGIACSDVRHRFVHSVLVRLGPGGTMAADDRAALSRVFGELHDRAAAQIASDGLDPAEAHYGASVEMKYIGQAHELGIAVPGTPWTTLGESEIARLVAEFRSRYDIRYGQGAGSTLQGHEITTATVEARVPTGVVLAGELLEEVEEPPEPNGERPVLWRADQSRIATRTYLGERLAAGAAIPGPAVVDMYATTVPVPVGALMHVDQYGNLVLEEDPVERTADVVGTAWVKA